MGRRHTRGGIPFVSARRRGVRTALFFTAAIVSLLLACPEASAQSVPRNFDEEYALYNRTVDDIVDTGKANQKCWTLEARNGLIARIDKAISLIKEFAFHEGIKVTKYSLSKFVNPQLTELKKPPSQFGEMAGLAGWTNFMVGRLTYLRGKILDMPICKPAPPPKEVPPQCPAPADKQATIDALKARLKTLWEKAPLGTETYTKEDLMNRIGEIQAQESQLDQEIKKVEENPGLVPQGEHPGTYLDKLKARKKKHEENLKTLNEMLELLNRIDALASYERCSETGLYAGLEGFNNWGRLHTTEREAETEEVTHEFTDNHDPFGGGVVVGYNLRPFSNAIIVGPFGSFDWLDETIKRTFGGGSFIGAQSNWVATVGGKAGVATPSGLFLYGLAGAGWLNTELNVKFATASSRTTTVPGFTLGGGGEYQPSALRIFGEPMSVFLQYQHSWWQDADFNRPASSPNFNYTFKRDDDTIKFGLNVYLGH